MKESVRFEKFSPLEYCNGSLPEHVVFDPDVEKQYDIIRQSTHDGTLYFTRILIAEALCEFFQRKTCDKTTAPDDRRNVDISYIIGEVELKSEFGMKDLPVGIRPGQTDTVTIPVKCIYTRREG